jgi:hypothetical protein
VLIPISFLAIRLANDYIHPVAFTARAADVGLAVLHVLRLPRGDAVALLGAVPLELAGKRLDASLRELRELLG